jgi:hypothetical protein
LKPVVIPIEEPRRLRLAAEGLWRVCSARANLFVTTTNSLQRIPYQKIQLIRALKLHKRFSLKSIYRRGVRKKDLSRDWRKAITRHRGGENRPSFRS